MTRLAVVYDSNVYLSLRDEELAVIAAQEQQHSIMALASDVVLTEFLYHISDPSDQRRSWYVARLKRLAAHCETYDGAGVVLNFAVNSDDQLLTTVFGPSAVPADRGRRTEYSDLVRAITTDSALGLRQLHALDAIRAKVDRAEAEFHERLWERVVLRLSPNAVHWADICQAPSRQRLVAAFDAGEAVPLIARVIIERACSLAGRTLSGEAYTQAEARLLGHLATPVHVQSILLRRLIDRGRDMSLRRRRNTVWDYLLSFCVVPGAVVGSLTGAPPVWLISKDAELLAAGKSAGAQSHLKSLDQYRAAIADRDSLAAALVASAP